MYPAFPDDEWYEHPQFIQLLRTGGALCLVGCATALFLAALLWSPEAGMGVGVGLFVCSSYLSHRRDAVPVGVPVVQHPGAYEAYLSGIWETAEEEDDYI